MEPQMKIGTDYIGNTVIFLCHDGEGNYLFAKRSTACRDEHGVWDCGGGGIEFGHSPEETVIKEIAEEYCTDASEIEFLGYRDVHRVTDEGKPTHWIAFDFKVRVDRSKVSNGEPHKLDELSWFRLDALPTPLHSQLPYTLGKYRDRL